MTFVDTAGVHSGAVDPVELEGIARAVAVRDVASVVVIVLDRSRPLDADDHALLDATRARPRVVVANKSDAPSIWETSSLSGTDAVETSATVGTGIDRLRTALVEAASGEPLRDAPAITNARHVALLRDARAALVRAETATRANTPEEFVLADLSEARRCLEEVTGVRTSDDVLRAIFERFCIGK
jgi:tRNA modification GTPase